ncbi:hypothetical protein Trydic_g14970, partial [Trypoxylus dichotomus]
SLPVPNHEFPSASHYELEERRPDNGVSSPTRIKMRRRTSSPSRLHPIILENIEEYASFGSYVTFVRRLEQNDGKFCVRGAREPVPDVISGDSRASNESMANFARILRAVEQELDLHDDKIWVNLDETFMCRIVDFLVKVLVSPCEY